MNLESHPAMHYIMVLIFYHLGLLVNVLAGARIATQSNLNALKTIRQYFVLRAVPLFIRYVLCLGLFLFVWENPSIPLNLERFMPNLPAHLGVGIFLGWGCDAIFDKIVGLFGIQQEMPPLPPADPPKS